MRQLRSQLPLLRIRHMGYRFTCDYLALIRDTCPDRIVFERSACGARCVVVEGVRVPGVFSQPGVVLVYIGEDNEGNVGTFEACVSVKRAMAWAAEILRELLRNTAPVTKPSPQSEYLDSLRRRREIEKLRRGPPPSFWSEELDRRVYYQHGI